jgi:twitching motility protein PilT
VAAIDSILGLATQQGATELRLGTDREPEMSRDGVRLRLALDSTPDETLRLLLGPLLSRERELALGQGSAVEFDYDVPDRGSFHVVMTRRDPEADASNPGVDVLFVRAGARRIAQPAQRAAAGQLLGAGVAEAQNRQEPVVGPTRGRRPMTDGSCAIESRGSGGAEPGAGLVRLLEQAVALGASDLHLREGEPPVVRIRGRLRPIGAEPTASLAELLGGSLQDGIHIAASTGSSVDSAFAAPGLGRFRLNVYAASQRPCASIRVLPESVPTLAALRLPTAIDDLIDLPHGLVVVCGPTGSGKSTTLAALAQEALRRRSIVVITLEDPIEYKLRAGAGGSVVRQREVGRDVRDFPCGLRDALREDPDLLLIGEMRDAESVGLTLTAAETGHLVLASLHSRSAASAVERMVDCYPPERQQQIRVQLADALRVVISQRLIPSSSGDGRTVALEVLRVNHNVANLIREGRTAQIATAMQSGRKEGQLPLERCLADLIRAGQVQLEDARAVSNDAAALASYVRG